MKIKKIKKLKINSFNFTVIWDKTNNGGSFSYYTKEIKIGIKNSDDSRIFEIIMHELMEIVAVDMNVRLERPDCDSDYIFVYDHRQYDTMMNILASLVSEFIV